MTFLIFQIFIPQETIRRVCENIELPSEDLEAFLKFGIDDDVKNLAETIKLICAKIKPKVLKTEEAEILQRPGDDTWQNLEAVLRKCIGEIVREEKSGGLARALCSAKKEILAEFRAENRRDWDKQDLKEALRKRAVGSNVRHR